MESIQSSKSKPKYVYKIFRNFPDMYWFQKFYVIKL